MSVTYWILNRKSGSGAGRRIARVLDGHSQMEALSIDDLLERASEGTFGGEGDIAVVAAGGDGTFSAVLGALSGTQVPVALYPLGTGNDLARELGVKRQQLEYYTFRNLHDAVHYSHTVWELQGPSIQQRFVNYFSLGYDSLVIQDFERIRALLPVRSRLVNRLLYMLAGFRNIAYGLNRHQVQIEDFDDEKVLCSYLFANISSVLGLGRSSHHSSSCDELLELIPIPTPFSYPLLIASEYFPRLGGRGIGSRGRWNFELREPTPYQFDGEAPQTPLEAGSYTLGIAGRVNVVVP